MNRRVVLATLNAGKVRELTRLLGDLPVTLLSLRDIPGASLPSETGTTYAENALIKARAARRLTGHAALGDDSGLEVDALGGAPGPRSARFAGPDATDEANLRKLIDAMLSTPEAHRTARYRCVAVLATPGGNPAHAEATCEGTLVTDPRGSGGFGYDPIFVPRGETRTMAELTPEEKDAISHRGKAFRALRDKLV